MIPRFMLKYTDNSRNGKEHSAAVSKCILIQFVSFAEIFYVFLSICGVALTFSIRVSHSFMVMIGVPYTVNRSNAEIRYNGIFNTSSPFVSFFIDVLTEYLGVYFLRYSARERDFTLRSDFTSTGTISEAL